MVLDALEYLSQASEFRVKRVYGSDWNGIPTDEFIGYEVTRTQSDDDEEIYAFVDEDGITYRIRGNYGYEGYDARINLESLKELVKFCETMTKGESDGRQQ